MDVTKPYMCCGGTVATMAAPFPGVKPRRRPPVSASRTTVPQYFRYGLGRPVLPEVKAIATSWDSGNDGMGKSPPAASADKASVSDGITAGASVWSVKQ